MENPDKSKTRTRTRPNSTPSGVYRRTAASLTSQASSADFNEMIKKLPQGTAEYLVRTLFPFQAPQQHEIQMVYIQENHLVKSILKVEKASRGPIRNQNLLQTWEVMNDVLVMYQTANHRLLRALDLNMEEDVEQIGGLTRLVCLEYGQHAKALVDLATLITVNINDDHDVDLELNITKARDSTQTNMEKHLSQMEISLDYQPETKEQQTPSLRDLKEVLRS